MNSKINVTVLHGSPKGEISITYTYLMHLQHQFQDIPFSFVHIASDLHHLETDESAWAEAMAAVAASDLVIWSFPIYFFGVPAQVQRFFELIRLRSSGEVFRGKYAGAISTSIRCFDHTAQNHVQAVSEDLGMRFVDGYSADMRDILDVAKRESFERFFSNLLAAVRHGTTPWRRYRPIDAREYRYRPEAVAEAQKRAPYRVALITDAEDPDANLARMTAVFAQRLSAEIDILNLTEAEIKGYCRGDCRCLMDTKKGCVYKDGVSEMYDRYIATPDAVIFAVTATDRFVSSRFKMFLDRLIHRGFTFRFDKTQIIFIVSGPLRENENLVEWIKGFTESRGASELCIVGDEQASDETTALLDRAAEQLIWAIENGYRKQVSFRGKGAMKVRRDFLYAEAWVHPADHQYYKKHRMYDFPTRDYSARIRNAVFCALLRIPSFRAKVRRMAKHAPAKYLLRKLPHLKQ